MKTKFEQDPEKSKLTAYSPAVRYNLGDHEMIFLAGHIAVDEHGDVVAPGDAAGQTRFVFNMISSLLRRLGAGLNDLVKVQIFLTDISTFKSVSEVRNSFLRESAPASTLVEVRSLVRPECLVEIDAIAIRRIK